MQKIFGVELVFVLILFAGSGESLKCYVCRSDIDVGCSGEMNQSLSQECPQKEDSHPTNRNDNYTSLANKNTNGHVFCRKIHQKLRFRNEESWTSIRECAYEKGKKDCYILKWVELAYQETCECADDNCNRGNSHNPSFLSITATVSVWMFNYLKADHT